MTFRSYALAFAVPLAACVLAPAAAAVPTSYEAAVHAGARDLGPLSPAARVRLAVALRYRAPANLERLIAAQGDAGSPLYKHFLTPAQFANTFAPAPEEENRVVAILKRDGLRVDRRFPNRTLLDVSGTAAAVDRTFGTSLRRLVVDGSEHYATARQETVPGDLRATVLGVTGFDNLDTIRPQHAFGAASPLRTLAPAPQASGRPLYGLDGGAGPVVTATAYDYPVMHERHGVRLDGSGSEVAVVICGNFHERDLTNFLHYFGVTRTGPPTLQVPIDGGGKFVPFDRSGCSVEATLDVETIVGNAPGVQLALYSMPDLSYVSILDAYEAAVTNVSPVVVNSSFGGCEVFAGAFPKMSDALAQQGASLGQVFSAATGDGGSNPCYPTNPNPPPTVVAPASGPHFVAVGGTSLTVDAQANYVSETGWSGSGGGISGIFPVPAYQRGVPHLQEISRNTPDVAFVADPALPGASFYYLLGWYGPIGGTSWASPLFCALNAEIVQGEGGRLPDVHAALYGTARKSYTFFHDITSGSNGFFNAAPGYDNVTGIGSIVGFPFATHV